MFSMGWVSVGGCKVIFYFVLLLLASSPHPCFTREGRVERQVNFHRRKVTKPISLFLSVNLALALAANDSVGVHP